MYKICTVLFASILLGGCGGTDDGAVNLNGLPPVEAGYTRFEAPMIRDIKPGVDGTWCQYVSAPFDADMDVADFRGWQSVGGHHLVLYATTAQAPLGTTRECTDTDMLAVRFLGAVGGEGVSNVGKTLPEGATFRIPKGHALMANTHYLNAGSAPIDGSGYIDMKLSPADPLAKNVAMLVNINQNISVAPHQTGSLDANCVVQKDIDLYVAGNHMHQYGKAIYTEIVRKDGTTEMLLKNDTWSKEMTFNPQLITWAAENPLRVNVGDTVHTRCEWNNTSAEELAFPGEMCVGFSFFVGENDVYCTDGVWDAQ